MASSLPTARVGRIQFEVSKMGLGTAPIGSLFRTITQEQAEATVRYALDHGIRFIDTAPYYGFGQSERYLGTVLPQLPRSSFVLSTKVGRLITPDGRAVFNFTRDGILRSFEESLKRLKLDHVDILLVHDPDDHYQDALDFAFPTLAELRSQGVVKAIGAGMNQWQMLAQFAREADPDCFLLAGRYTLLEQGAINEFLPLCQSKGISVFLGGVYNSGILARGPWPGAKYNYEDAPPEIMERVQRIAAVCERYQVPLNVAALQFPLAHPAVTALIVGAEEPQEVEANLNALHAAIPPALWSALRSQGLLHQAAPVPQG